MLLVIVSNFNTVQLQKTDFLQQVSLKIGKKKLIGGKKNKRYEHGRRHEV